MPAGWRVGRWHRLAAAALCHRNALTFWTLDVRTMFRAAGTDVAPAVRAASATPMFRITTSTADDELVMKLEGCLCGAWVAELETCWRGVAASLHGRGLRVDLTDVCHVDHAGRELLASMLRSGARFLARGCVMPELVREISDSVAARRN